MLSSGIPGHPSFLNVWGMATSDLSSPMGIMQQKALQSEVWLPRFTTVHSTHLSSRWAGKKPLHLVRKDKKGSTREARWLNLMSFRGRVRPHWEGAELPDGWWMESCWSGLASVTKAGGHWSSWDASSLPHCPHLGEGLTSAERSSVAFLSPPNSQSTHSYLRPQTELRVPFPQSPL